MAEQGLRGRAEVAGAAAAARGRARDGVHVTSGHGDIPLDVGGGGDLLDAVVAGVGDVDVAGRVDRDAGGLVQLGRGSRPAIARVTRGAGGAVDLVYVPDRHRDAVMRASGGRDLLALGVAGVGDEDVAGRVHRDGGGHVQPGTGSRSAVTRVTARPVA